MRPKLALNGAHIGSKYTNMGYVSVHYDSCDMGSPWAGVLWNKINRSTKSLVIECVTKKSSMSPNRRLQGEGHHQGKREQSQGCSDHPTSTNVIVARPQGLVASDDLVGQLALEVLHLVVYWECATTDQVRHENHSTTVGTTIADAVDIVDLCAVLTCGHDVAACWNISDVWQIR